MLNDTDDDSVLLYDIQQNMARVAGNTDAILIALHAIADLLKDKDMII